MDNIRLGNLRFDQHSAHIRQRQNVRRLLGGNYRLPLQRGDLGDFTGHRRNDLRVVEVGFRRVQRGLITFDLCVDGANLRLLDRQLRRGSI